LGAQCADIYFQEVNVTGAWADIQHPGGFRFHANESTDKSVVTKLTLGKIDLKIVRGSTAQGISYLNVRAQRLSTIGVPIGGLLGEDDHTAEEMPSQECGRHASLAITGRAHLEFTSMEAASLE